MFAVAGSGHRPDKLGGYGNLAEHARLEHVGACFLAALRPDVAISGMAQGWDTIFARAALRVGIPLIAHVVCGRHLQPSRWPEVARLEYHRILSLAFRVDTISPGPWRNAALQERNESMVDAAYLVVANWDGSAGGTANCLRYAKRRGVPVVNLWGL